MRRVVLLVILALVVLWSRPAIAQPIPTTIELVTILPGDALWMRFGHTAVRVMWPGIKTDAVYSYGNARFTGVDFLWSYVKGEAHFRAAPRSWVDTLAFYKPENRTVLRLPLRLTDEQAKTLGMHLERDVHTDRASYLYDQLEKNCATQVRDAVDEALGGALRRWAEKETKRYHYRDFTLRAGAGDLPLGFGLDFIGGPNQDREIDLWQAMYIPEVLHESIARMQLEDGQRIALAAPVEALSRAGAPATDGYPKLARVIVLAFAVLLGALMMKRRNRVVEALHAGALILVGLCGSAILVVVAYSKVADFRWNENVLAWSPLMLVLGVCALRFPKTALLVARVQLGLLALALVLRLPGVLRQDNLAFVFASAALVLPLVSVRRTASTARLADSSTTS